VLEKQPQRRTDHLWLAIAGLDSQPGHHRPIDSRMGLRGRDAQLSAERGVARCQLEWKRQAKKHH
jgi:hypothetical protein